MMYDFKVPGPSACAFGIYREGEWLGSVPCSHFVTALILTWTVPQRAPDCELALVHDDDLERILGVGNGTVS